MTRLYPHRFCTPSHHRRHQTHHTRTTQSRLKPCIKHVVASKLLSSARLIFISRIQQELAFKFQSMSPNTLIEKISNTYLTLVPRCKMSSLALETLCLPSRIYLHSSLFDFLKPSYPSPSLELKTKQILPSFAWIKI